MPLPIRGASRGRMAPGAKLARSPAVSATPITVARFSSPGKAFIPSITIAMSPATVETRRLVTMSQCRS